MKVLPAYVWAILCAQVTASPPEPGKASLKVGDPAPPLSIQEWVTNSPVDLAAGKGKECYAIWFWQPGDLGSTQLTPRMTVLQNRYADQGLKVVGVVPESEYNSLESVRKYVQDAGPKLQWTAAYDKAKETWTSWVVASLKPGEGPSLPKVYFVDRKGILVWIGTPADPDMEDVLIDVVHDRHDLSVWEKVTELWGPMGGFARRSEWEKASKQLDEVLRIYPASSKALNTKVFIYSQQLKDFAAMRAWAQDYVAAYGKDPHVMFRLAIALNRPSAMGEPADRDPTIVYQAGRTAYEAARDTKLEGDVAPVYARILKEVGAVPEAMAVLSHVVDKVQSFERDQLLAELAYYKKCLQIREQLAKEPSQKADKDEPAKSTEASAAPGKPEDIKPADETKGG